MKSLFALAAFAVLGLTGASAQESTQPPPPTRMPVPKPPTLPTPPTRRPPMRLPPIIVPQKSGPPIILPGTDRPPVIRKRPPVLEPRRRRGFQTPTALAPVMFGD